MRLLAWQILLAWFSCSLAETPEPWDVGIVGLGPGGAYAAWRAVTSGKSVCIFERGVRPGGRIHSVRGQGPKGDLVVEAGAYRFAPKTVYAKFGNFTWKISTPLTAAIVKELGLHTAIYNPNASQWDHGMHKIVDQDGHNIGFLTFVEHMVSLAQKSGAKVRYQSEAVGIQVTGGSAAPSHGPVGIRLASGEVVLAKTIILNLPQRPLVELLRNSDQAISNVFPRPLYNPIGFPIMKMYVHYEDAWWQNDLGLVSGPFFNTEPTPPKHDSPDPMPSQLPTPFQGQYHDGDVRCDGKGGRCRGFLQAFYGGDSARVPGEINKGLSYYRVFHDSLSEDAVVQITPSKAHHRELLSEVHASLIDFHRSALDARNATARVSQMRPTGAAMSIWSEGVNGFHAGCHSPKGGNNPAPKDLPNAALQPLPGWPIFVANEAFGPMNCFAEGSLFMAEAAMKRMNISTPQWVTEAMASAAAERVDPDSTMVNNDPWLMRDGKALQPHPSGGDENIQVPLPLPVSI